ncbi:MAG: efflux RND transporter permease subunit [Rhodanobacter sp.]
MLCSRFVKANGEQRKNWRVADFDRGFNAVQRGYTVSLRWCMDRARLVLAAFGLSLLATALLFYVTPKDFIPAGDNRNLHINSEGPEDISFDRMVARQRKLVDVLAEHPNIAGYMSSIGAGGSRSTVNNGSILLLLKPAGERKLDLDAIMLIDFALERQRKEGMEPAQAIFDACRVRFRPIMMTSMAAMAGTLPIALSLGAGAEVRRSLGLAVAGGLIFSQIFTLYLTPEIYLSMDRLQQRFQRKGRVIPTS